MGSGIEIEGLAFESDAYAAGFSNASANERIGARSNAGLSGQAGDSDAGASADERAAGSFGAGGNGWPDGRAGSRVGSSTKFPAGQGSSADEPRIMSASLQEDELAFDRSLRPRSLRDYVGQAKIKESLAILIEAAKARGEAADHILFSGPPGLGKTTLSAVVANELGANIKTTSGPAIERTGDLAAILTNLEEGDVLFIDEIHRLNHMVEEVLYPALEDFALDIVVGKGPAARSIRLDLPRFTLIGATTRTGLLTGPLRDRFGIAFRLQYYEPEELAQIVLRSAGILDVQIAPDGALEIARRSRGTPRLANRLLKRVRDWAQVRGDGMIDEDVAAQALCFYEVDALGLDPMDNKILELLAVRFGGRPVGLTTIASALSEDVGSIEDVYEPFLMQQGLIVRTPKGRQATARAYAHLGVKPPESA